MSLGTPAALNCKNELDPLILILTSPAGMPWLRTTLRDELLAIQTASSSFPETDKNIVISEGSASLIWKTYGILIMRESPLSMPPTRVNERLIVLKSLIFIEESSKVKATE